MRVGVPSTPSAAQRTIARAAIAALTGTPRLVRYWDDSHRSSVDIVTSYATVGVFAAPLVFEGRELEVRTELVGACYSPTEDYAGCLATAAFFVINSGVLVALGVILPDIVALHRASKTMAHMLFVPPFLWDERLKTPTSWSSGSAPRASLVTDASPLIAIWMREEPTERAKSLVDMVWAAQTTALQATAGLG